MKKTIIKILLLTILFFPTYVFASSNYNIIVETGLGSRTGYIPRKNSYWRHGNQQGLRVTLVDSINGNRVTGSSSVDYTELKNVDYYRSFTKNSKIEYVYNNAIRSGVSLTKLSASPYVYKSAPVSLPTFVYSGTGANTISNDVLYKYFEDNYLPNTKSVSSLNYVPMNNLVSLLIDLKAPSSMINDIKASRDCIYKDTCPTVFSNLKSKYNYSLIVEPIGFFWAKRGNTEYYFAATATELGLMFTSASDAGFMGGASHRNIPKSIYMVSDAFNGRLKGLTGTLKSSMRNNTFLSSGNMTSSNGVGVGVIAIWDEISPGPVKPEPVSCTPVRTCENGVCDNPLITNVSTYKDSEDWNCIQASGGTTNDMNAENKGNATYCPVFCRETVTTSFPKPASQSYIVGTSFSFEPISITSSKECRTDVDLTKFRADYNTANNQAVAAYKTWKTLESMREGWNDKTRIGACSVKPDYTTIRTFDASNALCLSTNLFDGVTVTYSRSTVAELLSYGIVAPPQFVSAGYTCLMSTSSYETAKKTLYLDKWENPVTYSSGYTEYSVLKDNVIKFNSYKMPSGVTCTAFNGESFEANSLDTLLEKRLNVPGRDIFLGVTPVKPAGLKCTEVERIDVPEGDKYRYSYYDYSAGETKTIETCSTKVPVTLASISSAKQTFLNNYAKIGALETAISKCTDWDVDYTQNPSLKAVQTQTVGGKIVTNEYNLVSTKTVIDNEGERTICLNGANCNTSTLAKYNFTTRDGSSNYGFSNVRFSSTGIPLYERVANTATFKFDFDLEPNTNRYLIGMDGQFSNTIPVDYRLGGKFEGAYKDKEFPGFGIDLKADITRPGTISIKYKNIGEGGKFDSCFDVASPVGFSKDSNGFATYMCPYTYKRPDSEDYYDCSDPSKPCPNPSDCLKDPSKCPIITEDTGINVIYRPIDLDYPFAAFDGKTREPGFNWDYETNNNLVDKYILNNRGVKSEEVYNMEPMYVIDFTGVNKFIINEIRSYNKKNNYDNETLKCTGKDSNGNFNFTECRSTFLRTGSLSTIIKGCGMSTNWNACKGVNR